MDIMTHAKFHFNLLMLTLIFGIRASEPPPEPDRVNCFISIVLFHIKVDKDWLINVILVNPKINPRFSKSFDILWFECHSSAQSSEEEGHSVLRYRWKYILP